MTETLARPVVPAAEERARLKQGAHIERSSRRVRTYFGNKLSPTASTFSSSTKRSDRRPTGFRLRMSGWSIWRSHSKRKTQFAGAWW